MSWCPPRETQRGDPPWSDPHHLPYLVGDEGDGDDDDGVEMLKPVCEKPGLSCSVKLFRHSWAVG